MLEILSIFISEAPGDSIGGSLNGVMLKNDIFMEPGDPAVGGVTGLNKWQRGALQRQERFKHVMHALERLMHWARAEKALFHEQDDGCHTAHEQTCAASIGQRLAKRR